MADPNRPTQNRIIVLDVLRGFALFGVLLVNMLDFSGSGLRAGTLGTRGSPVDQVVDLGIVVLAMTKFYLLFSFLFGVGFAVQMRRVEGSGRHFVGLYLRRLVVLLVIGMAHAILVWDGDILRLYAIAGLMLLLLRRAPTRLLLGLALAIGMVGLVGFGAASNLQQISVGMTTAGLPYYTGDSYVALVQYRVAQQKPMVDIQIPMVLVMFLLGLVVGREGLLEQPDRYRPFLRRWWKVALPVGLVGSALLVAGYAVNSAWLVSIAVHIGAPALSFAYVAAVLLNAERLRWLAPVGQMALSNYLTQSLVCTTLFYGYGFGLYDRVSPALTLTLVLLLFGAQMLVSAWWMRRFRFGLMEWLWRSLTYWRIQPLLRTA
ncbi:MAG: DUF418 domain-containing protein [Chloroflexi bacterium]|nr:DUF418 domain-containing protein [Chloroflexota bacterium]